MDCSIRHKDARKENKEEDTTPVSYTHLDMKNQEISREKDYVQRVFYLSDYAKELRLTQMYQVMLQKMKQSVARLKETVSQYGFSIMTLEYILALLYEVGVYFVSILVAVYRTLVSKTMLLGDCFVVINSLTNIAYLVGEFGDIFVAVSYTHLSSPNSL